MGAIAPGVTPCRYRRKKGQAQQRDAAGPRPARLGD
jgi:hypothetical protein